MSDGGKGSTPRPFSVDYDKYIENWNQIFKKRLEEVDEMVRVSGVPYEVDLPKQKEPDGYDIIATMEQENRQMRARMDRLEDENRRLEEEIVQLRIRLHNEGQHASGNH
jgi:hypothetical protein